MDLPLIASVAVSKTTFAFDKLYDYVVPDDLVSRIHPGVRVSVPFGRGSESRTAVVFGVSRPAVETAAPRGKLKKIISVPDSEPLLDAEALDLCLWLKERTFCTLFDAVRSMVPPGMLGASTDALDPVFDHGVAQASVSDEYDADAGGEKLTSKQRSVMDLLLDSGSASVKEICYYTGVTPSVVTALARKGLIVLSRETRYRRPEASPHSVRSASPALSDAQAEAYRTLDAIMKQSGPQAALLYGVTGSGKTEVYIRLIHSCVSSGRSCIVMVPEISLTPKLTDMFVCEFGADVAVFHSGLTMGERTDEWKRVKRGEAHIVIGTRSAVFAPLRDIGLIVIDEEQEHTYRSDRDPRFNAREVAAKRCGTHGAMLLLSSATPSISAYYKAMQGVYRLVTLPSRYGDASLPDVRVVDMNDPAENDGEALISSTLRRELADNLSRGEQSILLINRRGCNTFAVCTSCKKVVTCPNCSVSLTYHSANNRLMCHYCGYSVPYTETCPSCGEMTLRYSGAGTQRIENELTGLFPDARILRFDADTVGMKNSHRRMLESFGSGEYDILLGTQMVSKGLDFPKVTLAGVLSVDSQLFGGDFRSSEDTFDLLTQVVGRSGRGSSKGRAVIQTMAPDNDIIALAAAQDYGSFYETESALRRTMLYPPFCDICSVLFTGPDESKTAACAIFYLEELKKCCKADYSDVKCIVLRPMPPRISRLGGRYRYRLLIKCRNDHRFRDMTRALIGAFLASPATSGVTCTVDIDPESSV